MVVVSGGWHAHVAAAAAAECGEGPPPPLLKARAAIQVQGHGWSLEGGREDGRREGAPSNKKKDLCEGEEEERPTRGLSNPTSPHISMQ